MRYIIIFAEQIKQSVMSSAMYRVNFWLMLIQSMINSAIGILCIQFIYGSVDIIAGWNRHEMIILICTAQIVSYLYRGVIHFNQNRFVYSVGSGDFDRMLLRPMSLVFQVNTGPIDISGLIATVVPISVLISQVIAIGPYINPLQIGLFILFVFNGIIILTAFMLLLFSAVFLFVKVDGIGNIYYLLMDITNKPQEIFSREFMLGFIFVIPAIPIANGPVSILLGRADVVMMLVYFGVGMVFVLAAWLALRMGLRRYTSASS